MNLPIAEKFISIQGEGIYTGCRMLFIRLAGCNVGVYHVSPIDIPIEEQVKNLSFPIIYNEDWHVLSDNRVPKHSICTNYQGTQFLCDTDYHKKLTLSVPDIIDEAVKNDILRICITGGEPFLHNLKDVVYDLVHSGFKVHIETSGTLPIPDGVHNITWITCSPKKGFLKENCDKIDEYKFVTNASDEDLEKIEEFAAKHVNGRQPIYLQPINPIHTVNRDLLNKLMSALHRNYNFRLSIQLHKILGVQ